MSYNARKSRRYLFFSCVLITFLMLNYPERSSSTMTSPESEKPLQVHCNTLEGNTLADGEHAPNMTFISTKDLERNLFGRNISKIRSVLQVINEEFDMSNVTSLRQTLDKSAVGFEKVVYLPGGHWKPKTVTEGSKVALLVPFRSREKMLGIFLRHMVSFLRRQRLEFAIFVIEQANDLKFNRGMLANVGFKEAIKFDDWDCIILHDIDFLPRFDQNSYTCRNMPRHFMSGLAKREKLGFFEYNGVTGFTREQFLKMNGAPNRYWGWGGEDHDLRSRAEITGYNIYRTEWPYGYYDHIPHKPHGTKEVEKERKKYREESARYQSRDGLSNLKYPKPEVTLYSLYVKIRVNIRKLELKSSDKELK